jgi:phosphoribosylanthranilate isomerase
VTLVKICGITNIEDALDSVEFGADMIGLNFYRNSVRYVPPTLASQIANETVPSVKKVGLFVNASIEHILEICSIVSLDAIQLHGDETVDYEADLRRRTELETIKAFRVRENFDVHELVDFDSTILLDAYRDGAYGGTGEIFDWEIASQVWTLVPCMILAGGLSHDNVADAVRIVRPYAVDVASGVESSPGKKDRKKLEAFITNAKNA